MGTQRRRVTKDKDGVYNGSSSNHTEKHLADEKERKARTLPTLIHGCIPKDHLRTFSLGMDEPKKIWSMPSRQGLVESLEKGYDRFQKLLSQLDALGAGVSDEDANHKFLRSLPPAWDSLAMTMRTKKNIDTLSIDDLYNNLSVFEQDIQKTSSSSLTSDNVAFLSQAKASSSKHKPSHSTGSYGSYTTSSSKPTTTATPGLADEVIHSFLATNADDVDLIHEDLDQIDDLDLEEMDINWQIAMTAIKIKKFYKKTGRRPRVDGKMHVAFDKRKVECFNCHNTGHFARECKFKGSKEGSRQEAGRGQDFKPVRTEKEALMTIDEGYEEEDKKRYFALRERRMRILDIPLYSRFKQSRLKRVNVNTGHGNVSSCSVHVNSGTQIKSSGSRFNTGHGNVSSGSVHVNSGTQIKSGGSRFNTGKQNVNSGRVHVNTARVNRPVLSNQTSNKTKLSQVNLKSPKKCFSKQSSPVNRPFSRTTAYKSNKYAVKGKMAQLLRPHSVGFWRKAIPLSNTNGGPTPDSNVHVSRGPQGRPKPVKAWKQAHLKITRTNQSGICYFWRNKGSKEVIDIDVHTEEAAELMVVSSTSQTEATRKTAISEKIATKKTHSPKQPSSTPISKSADDIIDNLNTGFEEVTPGNIEAFSPSADHGEEVFSDADDDEMPEIRIYDKSSEGIFEKASYDDDGIITDFNNLPDEVDVSTNHTLRIHNAHPHSQILGDPNTPVQTRSSLKKITEAHALVSHIQAQQRTNHKDQQHCLFAYFLSQSEPRKVSKALEDESWVEAMQEELLQFKLQQVWVLVDLPHGAKVIDPNTPVQTRSSLKKITEAHALVSHIQAQQRTNHKDQQHCLFAYFLSQSEPRKVSKALEDESWVEAMQEELLQFKLQQVWVLVDLPNGAKVIGQEEGIDYDAVLATCSKKVKLSVLFCMALLMNVYVYVSQPPGFVDPDHPTKVYKVVKALYGLHQAPRAWYATLSTFLEKHGYKRGTIDKTLFIRRNKKDIMLVQVYVDDIIFGSTNKSWCDEFEALMQSRFQMSSMGELTFFLGLQVKQNKEGIFISQDKYVAEILKKFDLVNVKAAITPMETKLPLTKDEEAFDVDVHLYRSMIGSLMYLTASRPDIMYAVCVCSRFQVTPKTSHLNAVKRIFKYLKGKPNLGLWYPRESPLDLEAFSDSDYGGSNLDRKSTTGGCQFLGQRLISWQCKKQTIVATSTTEAEYVAAANCCGQVLWVQNQLLDYGFNFMNTKIHIDNESTICIVKNPVYHSKTKHIEIRHHFIRDCYEKKLISVEKIHTDLNVADLLTKPFDGPRFNYLVVSIGMINP
ncbi:putative ribonuclease H-like domain-containing protein [Tanacetum coccineum]|uniref:Ribonuclease H-like domain-containing protein n=1 Tax=Tanacetum coccineum TaxID=301880 RepID=A0ABQ5GB76_9ASTR